MKWIVEHRREVLPIGDAEIAVEGNSYNGWTLVCQGLDIAGAELSSKDFDDAREEALGIVAEELQTKVQGYKEMHERVLAVINGSVPE